MDLNGGAQDNEIWIHKELVGIAARDEVDGIAGNERELSSSSRGIGDNFGSNGIFGKVADEKVGIGGVQRVGEGFGVAKRAGGGGRQIGNIVHRWKLGLEGVGEDGLDVFEMGILAGEFGNFDGGVEGLTIATDNI